jgi:hypothetical protein
MLHSTRVSALLLAVVIAGTARSTEAQYPTPTISKGDVKVDRLNAEQLRVGMRKLWSDHVIWTREYIVNAVEADPTAEPSLKRLMKNQEDLGNAIVPYYGKDAGAKLTDLLKQHISIAGELVTAAIAKDNAKVSDADKRWHDNARELSTFLSGANPNWKKDDLVKMLDEHLSLTTREATLRLDKKWDEDVENFDRIFEQSMHMADALTAGIVKQFPNK